MEPRSSNHEPCLYIEVRDSGWHRLVRNPERWVRRAFAALADAPPATVVLGSDHEVKLLNARFRGKNKPTNVLTFDPLPGLPGDIILALGVVRREARAAGKRPAHHLAHLVVHGLLHLEGYDHQTAGEARTMERIESRTLSRLRVPNPWRHA